MKRWSPCHGHNRSSFARRCLPHSPPLVLINCSHQPTPGLSDMGVHHFYIPQSPTPRQHAACGGNRLQGALDDCGGRCLLYRARATWVLVHPHKARPASGYFPVNRARGQYLLNPAHTRITYAWNACMQRCLGTNGCYATNGTRSYAGVALPSHLGSPSLLSALTC